MSASRYRYHRAVAVAQLPADHPTANPRTKQEIAALAAFLFLHTRRAYRDARSAEADKYTTPDAGGPTAKDAALRAHAGTVAAGIATTLAGQLATAQSIGTNAPAVLQRRDVYKPEQIWQHEISAAQQQGMRDFHDDHPWLNATAHVEPADAEEPICQDAIDQGSIPLADIDISFPAHPGCPHGWVSDGPWGT